MYRLIAFALIISLVYTQQVTQQVAQQACDPTANIIYQGVCIAKACLNQKLAQFHLIQTAQQTSDIGTLQIGTLSTGITYSALASSDSNGNFYVVTLSYPNTKAAEILADPVNCVGAQIYSIVNSFQINPTRQFINVIAGQTDGQTPSWPITTYNLNAATSTASFTFNVRETDLATKCQLLSSSTSQQYNCYFEMAFQVVGITQVSYYFSMFVIINTAEVSNALPPVNFVKLIQQNDCSTSACQVNINIPSNLVFCDSSACANTQTTPFVTLFLNRQFFMKQLITDASFTTWFILNPSISFQSQGLLMTLATSEFTSSIRAGSNVYLLKVPIVATSVLITASGTLSPKSSRRLLQSSNSSNSSNTVRVVHAQSYTGQIAISNSSNTSNAKILASILFIVLYMII